MKTKHRSKACSNPAWEWVGPPAGPPNPDGLCSALLALAELGKPRQPRPTLGDSHTTLEGGPQNSRLSTNLSSRQAGP